MRAPHPQLESEQGGGHRGAVDGSVAPGGGQTHRVVAVHVGQEEEPRTGTLPHLPEVHSQRGVRDHSPVHGHDLRRDRMSGGSCVTGGSL